MAAAAVNKIFRYCCCYSIAVAESILGQCSTGVEKGVGRQRAKKDSWRRGVTPVPTPGHPSLELTACALFPSNTLGMDL